MHRIAPIARLAGLAVVVAALAACQPPAAAPAPPDYAAELGPKVDTFIGVWNSQDYAQLDGVASPEYIRRAPDQNADGLEAQKAFMKQVHATYPDFHIAVDAIAFAKNLAFLQWTVTGTYTAEGAEPKKVEVTGATLLRFADGMITEEHVFYDTAALNAETGTATVAHAAAK